MRKAIAFFFRWRGGQSPSTIGAQPEGRAPYERPKGERAKKEKGVDFFTSMMPKFGYKELKANNIMGKTQKRQLTSLVFFDLPNLYKKIDITLLC